MTRYYPRVRSCGLNWTHEQCLSLIEEFEHRRHLWDAELIDYKNAQKRNSAYGDIARVIGRSENQEISAKWNSLRGSYKREQRRELEYKEKGDSTESYKPSFEYYNSMKFLGVLVTNADTAPSPIQPSRNIPKPSTALSSYQRIRIINNADRTLASSSKVVTNSTPIIHKRKRDEHGAHADPLKVRTRSQNQTSFESRSDDAHAFGMYVASKMRLIPLHARTATEQDVMDVIRNHLNYYIPAPYPGPGDSHMASEMIDDDDEENDEVDDDYSDSSFHMKEEIL